MWENERRKSIIHNCLIGIALVFFAGVLGIAMLSVRKQIEEEDMQLSAAHVSQQQQQNDARQENIEAIQQAYEIDIQTVAQYMPGIVCWGDSLTAGSSGNASYPDTLQKYINTYLCDIYDFRSSIPDADNYSRLNWNDYKVSIPVINMGSGQEDNRTILGRAGVMPYVVGNSFDIPAEVERVAVSLKSPDGREVIPLVAGSVGINPVTIAGVEGTLSLDASLPTKTYYFERSTAGSEVHVEKNEEIITAAASEYKDYIHIVWLGAYSGYITASDLVRDVKLLLERQTQNSDRFLVIGPCTFNGSWTADGVRILESIDSAMLQTFGSHYVNVRKYLIEDGLSDAGLSPSKLDTTYLNQGCVPDSFRSGAGRADLNGRAYQLIGKVVYERMDRLGYFDEIRSELNIDQTMRDILKNDPKYFENQLRVG